METLNDKWVKINEQPWKIPTSRQPLTLNNSYKLIKYLQRNPKSNS